MSPGMEMQVKSKEGKQETQIDSAITLLPKLTIKQQQQLHVISQNT